MFIKKPYINVCIRNFHISFAICEQVFSFKFRFNLHSYLSTSSKKMWIQKRTEKSRAPIQLKSRSVYFFCWFAPVFFSLPLQFGMNWAIFFHPSDRSEWKLIHVLNLLSSSLCFESRRPWIWWNVRAIQKHLIASRIDDTTTVQWYWWTVLLLLLLLIVWIESEKVQ